MRKVYIIRDNEEDGVLLDALLARGIDPDEAEECHPDCPHCSSTSLLAFDRAGRYHVLTGYDLDEEDVAGAEHWYLVCSNGECEWEEEVERATNPFEASVIFDLQISFGCLDDEWSFAGGPPARQNELIAYIKELQEFSEARKLESFRATTEWYYRYHMKKIRAWFRRVPTGRLVEVTTYNGTIRGNFLSADDDGCTLMADSGELVTIEAETIDRYYPRRFDEWGPDEQEVQRDVKRTGLLKIESDSWTTIEGWSQHVVVRGHELKLKEVDRFGRYLVSTQDPHVGEALGLTNDDGDRWKGWFRRSEIEQRYDVRQMVKAKGYWVELSGYKGRDRLPSVSTEDPDAARALGLQPRKPIVLNEEGKPSLDVTTPRWYGVVPKDEVEEWGKAKTWHWPLPELSVD